MKNSKMIVLTGNNRFIAAEINRLFKSPQYEVTKSFDLSKALEEVGSNGYHLMIVDIHQLGPNGLDKLVETKRLKPETRLFVSVASGDVVFEVTAPLNRTANSLCRLSELALFHDGAPQPGTFKTIPANKKRIRTDGSTFPEIGWSPASAHRNRRQQHRGRSCSL